MRFVKVTINQSRSKFEGDSVACCLTILHARPPHGTLLLLLFRGLGMLRNPILVEHLEFLNNFGMVAREIHGLRFILRNIVKLPGLAHSGD